MAEYKGIMVYGEIVEGKLSSITTELLGCGRSLADELKEELSCILVGETLGDAPKNAIAFESNGIFRILPEFCTSWRLSCARHLRVKP